MPQISIFEKDLTTPLTDSTTDNICYVPGYAIMGPVNTPTLCTSITQFQEIFGSKPYQFRSAQPWPDKFSDVAVPSGDYAFAGDYEKSYIYASELLYNGLPVLFERVLPQTNITNNLWNASATFAFVENATDTLTILAKYPGGYGQFLTYEFTPLTQLLQHTINIKLAASQNTIYTSSQTILLYTDDALEVSSGISLPAGTQLISPSASGDYIQVSYNDGVYYVPASSGTTQVDSTQHNAFLQAGSIIAIGSTIQGESVTSPLTISSTTELQENDIIALGSQIAYGSVLNGESGSLQYIDYKVIGNSSNLYTLTITLPYNAETAAYGILEEQQETLNISFDSLSPNYVLNTESQLVSFALNQQEISNPSYTLNLGSDLSGSLTLNASLYTDGVLKDEFTVSSMYDMMVGTDSESIFDKLKDKGEFDIKFITSGSYPTFEFNSSITDQNSIVKEILTVAGTRGDVLGLIDHTNNPNRQIAGTSNTSLYNVLQQLSPILVGGKTNQEDARKYGAMFSPWATYQIDSLSINSILPGSFAYLKCLAISTQTNDNWYAIAGVQRGLVTGLLQPSQVITKSISDTIQQENGISINPILMVKPYGYCIWGNRTLFYSEGLVASSFLNIRALDNDVKKQLYLTAQKLTFELNSDVLWLNFKAEVEPVLDRMVSGNGLSNYKLIKNPSTKRATVNATVRLYPIEAVESWDITLELADSYTTIE